MHVRTAGGRNGGPPLVLLHMSPLSGRMFEAQIPLLGRDRLLVIPDRIGFGCSDRLAAPLAFPEYALATLDALDGLGVEEFDVVGIHTGSCEAIELATAHEARVRRVGVVAVPVWTEEEVRQRKARQAPPPEPAEDGSHLLWHWNWWLAVRTPKWGLPLLHARVLDHLATPYSRWTYHAVYDYPTAERVQQIRQPFLVLAPHDDLWTQTERALPLLPPQTTIVDLPHLDYEVFTLAAEELAGHIREFLA
jgi:pimeloyl-ACP methyl ester carboxylesterase